jgi:hypothetical protein
VVKAGRTTGTTEGEVSFLYENVRLDECGETTQEYTVYTTGGKSAFTDLGDSGGVVVNDHGMAIGMILGGTTGKPLVVRGTNLSVRLHYITFLRSPR